MDTHGDDTDVLGEYLRAALARLGSADFETVIRAADATCQLLADAQPALPAGPDGAVLGSDLQREYLALLAVLITGRTDHHIVALPAPDGTPGWAVIERHVARDPRALADVCARIAERARDSVSTGTALETLWRAS
ncbi:hypothetical protein [Streptomyces sp. Isolate_45]|uniref:hypothetical protein n=1 Tax=Streptomyces sp. Isolate_45 TaxID=2950111 RepID=UPI002481E46D|nr:hypothetical protein [Streptomyces sp. Isolate_45]MDA5283878.1 hypothetical protein [Streptomyces sp. Isolate_45]